MSQCLYGAGKCKVEETPKGWFITLISLDPAKVRSQVFAQAVSCYMAFWPGLRCNLLWLLGCVAKFLHLPLCWRQDMGHLGFHAEIALLSSFARSGIVCFMQSLPGMHIVYSLPIRSVQ